MAVYTRRCFQCSKWVLYGINIIFWMLGAALLGLGIWLHLTNVTLLTVSPGYSLLMPSALFIAPGCLSLIVGFLGCCGAVTENKCLILTYCVLVGILFVLEVSGSVATFVGEIHLKAHFEIKQQLFLSINEWYAGDKSGSQHEHDVVQGWGIIQREFQCCGVNSYQDWYKSHGWPQHNRVPDSCCIDEYVGCGAQNLPQSWYSQGCSDPLLQFITKHMYAIAVTTSVIAGFQLVTIGGAAIFLYYYKKHKEIR